MEFFQQFDELTYAFIYWFVHSTNLPRGKRALSFLNRVGGVQFKILLVCCILFPFQFFTILPFLFFFFRSAYVSFRSFHCLVGVRPSCVCRSSFFFRYSSSPCSSFVVRCSLFVVRLSFIFICSSVSSLIFLTLTFYSCTIIFLYFFFQYKTPLEKFHCLKKTVTLVTDRKMKTPDGKHFSVKACECA